MWFLKWRRGTKRYRRCKSAIARSTRMVFLFTSDMIFAVHAASEKPTKIITT